MGTSVLDDDDDYGHDDDDDDNDNDDHSKQSMRSTSVWVESNRIESNRIGKKVWERGITRTISKCTRRAIQIHKI